MKRLTDLIAPSFYAAHKDIKEEKHTYYDLSGGRGSTKSSFVSLEIVLGIVKNKDASAAIFRKVADTLRDSVYTQIGQAIDVLGLTDEFTAYVSPLRYVYNRTGQVITFHGLDKAKKQKSVKCPHGYYKYLWFEELDEFSGPEEIRSVEQSYRRGGDKFIVFKTFNPPISASNWANEYVQTPDGRSYRLKTDYRSVPKEWLGDDFIADAMHLSEVNNKAYRHEYLGESVGLGTDIFDNIEIRAITDEEIEDMERIYQGQDWGQAPDPKAFIRCAYNHQKESIFLLDEDGGQKIPVLEMAERIKKKGYAGTETICGADELESIHDFSNAGIYATKTDNRPGSVKYEMEWLQTRNIVIDPSRTPEAQHEIINYNYDIDSRGKIIPRYPDRENHYIDALRYATSPLSMKREAGVRQKPKCF